jgi:zinc transport system substrate-binding protein
MTKTRLRLVVGIAVALVGLFLVGQFGCHKAPNPWDGIEGGNIKVLVSFPPLYCFTKGVADKDAKVMSLLVAVGPHEHQAGADDAHIAGGADLFLVNGLQLDDFVTAVANASGNKKIKIVKIADEALPKTSRLKMHEEDGGDHAGHKHGEWDPHVWLGIEQAILMVQKICTTLKDTDAAHAADYDKRAAAYIEKLKQLQADGKKMLEGKKNRKIVASHESLAYFCKSFDLEVVGAIMPMAGVEPDAAQLAKLEGLCKEHNVRVVAIEPQYSRKDAETLLRALEKKGHKLVIVEIDPMETAPPDQLVDGDYYFRVMRRNLENLAKTLE